MAHGPRTRVDTAALSLRHCRDAPGRIRLRRGSPVRRSWARHSPGICISVRSDDIEVVRATARIGILCAMQTRATFNESSGASGSGPFVIGTASSPEAE